VIPQNRYTGSPTILRVINSEATPLTGQVAIIAASLVRYLLIYTEMSQDKQTDKPWGGRFSEPTDAFVERFTASVSFDQRLYQVDIAGSIAHVTMLGNTNIVSKEEALQMDWKASEMKFHQVHSSGQSALKMCT